MNAPRRIMRSAALASLIALACACAHADAHSSRPPAASAPPATAAPRVRAFGITTADLTAEEAFFRALEFDEREPAKGLRGGAFESLVGLDGARAHAATVGLGTEALVLTAFEAPAGRPMPEPTQSNDLWFEHTAIVVRDMDRAYAKLQELGVRPVSRAPQTIPGDNPAAGGIRAYYFRDREGHNLEIIWYPPGKGDPRWQSPGRSLFLGLDHSAIAVSSTERSLAFYRDVLGLHVAGESFNAGTEQENLSGVPGARVRITSLRGANGPGVEFLEYVAPKGGRPFPDATSADLVHWEITLEVSDVAEVAARAKAFGAELVSRGVSDIEALGLGGRRAAIVRDPDGHAVRLVQR
jgi:catechol 2,3-dioxygenase-like lactoylglutathione lyase family enzyme